MGTWSLVFTLYFFLCTFARAEGSSLDEWNEFSKSSLKNSVTEFIFCNAYSELHATSCKANLPATPSFFGHLGIFITIVNKGKVRGCFGAFKHKNTDLSIVMREYISGALKNDPRYPPLELEELNTSKFILTIADSPVQVTDTSRIALGRFGLLLSNENGQTFVYVPGEINSHRTLKNIIQREKIQEVSVFKAILIK